MNLLLFRGTQRLSGVWLKVVVGGLTIAGMGLVSGAISAQENDGNSTAKMRVKPSVVASKIGSAVQWETSVEDAMQKAKASGKPILWYVPTVPRTFMDRKTEIDRYMNAGPFSWPKIIHRLNSDFVPLRRTPNAKESNRWNLKTYEFVEPGFIVIDAEGKELQRVDELTTLHPAWLAGLIGRGVPGVPQIQPHWITESQEGDALNLAWQSFAKNPAAEIAMPDQFQSPDEELEFRMLLGMQKFYGGDHSAANEIWKQAISINPNSPLAWKCAAEREGFGPFVRGFEVHDALPEAAWNAGTKSRGSAAPENTYTEDEIWTRSVELLLNLQRADGAVVDSDYDFGGTDSLPNVHLAVTSLCGIALLHARDRIAGDRIAGDRIAGDRIAGDTEMQQRIESALRRIQEFVVDDQHINKVDRDEILWAYAYRLRFLCELKKRNRIVDDSVLDRCVKSLEEVQSNRGNWYHEYQNSFVTATALIALADAKKAGATLSSDKINLGLEALLRDRFSNGAFPYYSVRRPHKEGDEGDLAEAAGRMPVCETALWLWDKSDPTKLTFAVQRAIEHYPKLRVAYKYDNHTSTLSYGGFFFWFDLQSRADAIALLKDGEQKLAFAAELKEDVLHLPEIDGRFVDSHELGRAYGTSMALITLGTLKSKSGSK